MNKEEINKYVGERIRFYRKQAGLSQESVAAYLELSRPQLVNIELGNNGTSSLNIWKLCNALHCEPNDLYPPLNFADYKVVEVVKTKLVPTEVIIKKCYGNS